MTRETAVSWGVDLAKKGVYGEQDVIVFRMPKWPEDVFSFGPKDGIPPEAEKFEVFKAPKAQGSLF